jgi:hypothetical protein
MESSMIAAVAASKRECSQVILFFYPRTRLLSLRFFTCPVSCASSLCKRANRNETQIRMADLSFHSPLLPRFGFVGIDVIVFLPFFKNTRLCKKVALSFFFLLPFSFCLRKENSNTSSTFH